MGYSPWGRKESDTTERLHFAFASPCRDQYSCLENPMAEEPGRLQSMGSLRVRHD